MKENVHMFLYIYIYTYVYILGDTYFVHIYYIKVHYLIINYMGNFTLLLNSKFPMVENMNFITYVEHDKYSLSRMFT